MNGFDKFTHGCCRFEEATEMLRDLLSEGNRGRLLLAMKEACLADKEDMGRTLAFLDWLQVEGEDHLDGMLAEIHSIDPAVIENERRLRIQAMKNRRVRERALANHQAAQTRRARLNTELTRARLTEIKAQADRLGAEAEMRRQAQ